jgi:hypothetical protein
MSAQENKRDAGLSTQASLNTKLNCHLTGRLARTKRLLVGAYGLNVLTFAEAELIGSRLRRCYGPAWRAA